MAEQASFFRGRGTIGGSVKSRESYCRNGVLRLVLPCEAEHFFSKQGGDKLKAPEQRTGTWIAAEIFADDFFRDMHHYPGLLAPLRPAYSRNLSYKDGKVQQLC